MNHILDISDLHVHYPDGTQALHGVSLAMAQGERVALLGPNGAGKTSLMLAVMHSLHYTGRIVVDGIELSRRTAAEARGRCGMVFQDADDQLFMPTLLDDAAFGPLNQGLSPDEAQRLAREAISAVGLAGLETKAAHHLSGGQKRSASLATVLSMRVKLLLLDEPGANLDGRSRRRLAEILAGREEAMLLSTHDLELARQLCTRAVLLDGGLVAADRPVEELLGDWALLEAHGVV